MQLVRIFTPKHQKLVNQCYPSGRAPDKKPKSSETSYLMYYVGSRSSKLEKVSNYLIKRTNTDLNRRKVGNVCVTLELMAQIVDHCKENLNVFVKEFMTLLQMVLSNQNVNNDVSVIEILERTFHTICINMDSAYYSGDTEFVQMYKTFVDTFFDVIANRLNNDDLLLKLCGDISETMGLASDPQLNYLVLKCVGFAIDQCRIRNPRFNVNSLDEIEDTNLSKRLSRTQTRADETADLPTAETDLSVATLHNYFNTTETDKLNLSIRVFIRKLQEIPNKELLAFICNDIPVQLRYIVILLLTKQVTDFTKFYEESANQDFKSISVSLQLISALLVSDISIVGLSVLDIMRKVLGVQLLVKNNRAIVQYCRTTIKDLNTKTYYSEQTSDMLYELVVKLKNTEDSREREIIVDDIKILVNNIKDPAISVDLLTELVPFMKGAVIELLNNTEDHISGGSTLSRLFQMVRDLDSKDMQSKVMALLFEKYKGTILLSGLNYFQSNIIEPEYSYYLYHFNAAKVLNSNDYYKETQDKLNSNQLFSKDELLQYYKSARNGKFSDKAAQILMSYENTLSNTDLLNDQSRPMSPIATHSNSNNVRMNGLRDNNNGFAPIGPFASSRIVSDDVHSWRAMRPVIPKVSDLKKVMNNENGKSRLDKSFKGSQSVKSRVTNITFLLSELKSSAAGDESGIIDPDEEEVVGLDKMEIARSFSTRSKPRNDDIHSIHRSSFVPTTVDEDDEFRDANEDIENNSTRGKLFSAV